MYALSDPNDKDFYTSCDHLHLDSCEQCSHLDDVLAILENEFASANCEEEEKADMQHEFQRQKSAIMTWKAHLLRSVHQDEAKHSVLDKLDSKSVLLVQDWAMKYMPKKFREAQSDWFAKRGLPWHITVAIRRSKDGNSFEAKTLVHIFQSCSQDSSTVSGIMVDCLKALKRDMPELEKAYYKEDNAGCYHSGNTILSSKLAGDVAGITVARVDFSDPQGGKGVCDRQAATLKGAIGRHLNEGHDVNSGLELKTAIEAAQGITGVSATYVSVKTESALSAKIDEISLLNNFEFEKQGIRVWKAFNVGPGRLVPWNKFDVSTAHLCDLEVLSQPAQSLTSSHTFRSVRHRYKKKPRSHPVVLSVAGRCEDADEVLSSDDEDEDAPALFYCPEDGCTKAYTGFTSLQNHLDIGKHKRVPEQESFYDKAKREYASKLAEGCIRIPDVSCESDQRKDNAAVLSMGWALKTTKKKKRFTAKQISFLTDQFQVGEQSGRKADPKDVSKAMARERDESGKRVFIPQDVLTPQQITSFFSRLSAKKRLNSPSETQDDGDFDAASNESYLCELCDDVVQEIGFAHPITCLEYNICEMASKDNFAKLRLDELKRVCEELCENIDLSYKRKKPYIEKLRNLVEECCSCTST